MREGLNFPAVLMLVAAMFVGSQVGCQEREAVPEQPVEVGVLGMAAVPPDSGSPGDLVEWTASAESRRVRTRLAYHYLTAGMYSELRRHADVLAHDYEGREDIDLLARQLRNALDTPPGEFASDGGSLRQLRELLRREIESW